LKRWDYITRASLGENPFSEPGSAGGGVGFAGGLPSAENLEQKNCAAMQYGQASRSGRLLVLTRKFLGTLPDVLARSQEWMTVGGYLEMFGNSWRGRRRRQIGEIEVGNLCEGGDEDGCGANCMENPYVRRGAKKFQL
jgi:hypothetical protein